VVAYTLASNALGNIPDVARIAAAAHEVGALAWADAVHMAPHRRLDREALGADVVLCSPYKFFGPHVGLAAIRRDLAESLPADRVRAADADPPGHRFETGTLSHEALAGTVAAIDYIAGLGGPDGDRPARLDAAFAAIRAHEEQLTLRFLGGLAAIDAVHLHGIADPARVGERTPTFLISVAGKRPAAVAAELGDRGMFTWDGHFYAVGPVKALGLLPDGALRVGFLHYTTAGEVDDLAAALAEIAA
jgi:selenocysteine lyase/cysteine desulfurase